MTERDGRKYLPVGDAPVPRKLAIVRCHACGRQGVVGWAVIDADRATCSACGCNRPPRVERDGVGWGDNFVR